MARNKEMLAKLDEEIDELTRQIDALQNQRLGLQRYRAKLTGEDASDAPSTRSRARNVKDTVLGLLTQAASSGLTVLQVLELAEKQGKHLDRGSVSSLLSRLKREGILDFGEGVYRIKNPSASVVPLRSANGM